MSRVMSITRFRDFAKAWCKANQQPGSLWRMDAFLTPWPHGCVVEFELMLRTVDGVSITARSNAFFQVLEISESDEEEWPAWIVGRVGQAMEDLLKSMKPTLEEARPTEVTC